MSDVKPHRRPEFDEIATGWGGDGLSDLTARLELLKEFWLANFPLTAAEHKIAMAMVAQTNRLGGTSPVTFQ